ncbi:hypothetical protein PHET_01319 [Paragonimus heterotremus]|uniref:Uncharacterized protein n=1 Tax=Paragonimus heterotremus TaxID=100268 RepID=A0A8J4T428_9TREM|nr:hypothetical protein PHET_01319 [Paragonimus heterotremus]
MKTQTFLFGVLLLTVYLLDRATTQLIDPAYYGEYEAEIPRIHYYRKRGIRHMRVGKRSPVYSPGQDQNYLDRAIQY